MTINELTENDNPTGIRDFLADPVTRYTLIVSLSISFLIVMEAAYPHVVKGLSSIGWHWLEQNYPLFVTEDDRKFSQGFVEWFGTFYGFFLPLLLVRAWEQLDKADREFDREADSIKILLEDILLLDNDFHDFKKGMIKVLRDYVQHALDHYQIEQKKTEAKTKKVGDDLLQGIRAGYKKLIYRGGGKKALRLEPMTTELLERLNEAIDIRGDRISTFDERLFGSMKAVAIATSVIWLIPFYFLPMQLSGLGGLLKLALTFLIIFVLSIIDDLDKPFDGVWRVNTISWKEVQLETEVALSELEQQDSLLVSNQPVPTVTVNDSHNDEKDAKKQAPTSSTKKSFRKKRGR